MNEFVQALQDQRMDEFRARYRERCDLLLVDDIQFLAGKTQTQEEFFHAFNALHQADKQIIVTSDKYPQQLERDGGAARLALHVGARRRHPGAGARDARRHRAQEGAARAHRAAPTTWCLYLAQAVRSNVRELEGTLIRLAAKASLLGKPIDLEFARAGDRGDRRRRAPNEASVEDIQRVVCHHFKLRSTDLLSKDRHKSVAFARHVAMYLCKQRLKCSFPELGRAFGNRDHTTVMSAVRKVEALRDRASPRCARTSRRSSASSGRSIESKSAIRGPNGAPQNLDPPGRVPAGVEHFDAQGLELFAQGVGPREVLRRARVRPLADLRVEHSRVEPADAAAGARASGPKTPARSPASTRAARSAPSSACTARAASCRAESCAALLFFSFGIWTTTSFAAFASSAITASACGVFRSLSSAERTRAGASSIAFACPCRTLPTAGSAPAAAATSASRVV